MSTTTDATASVSSPLPNWPPSSLTEGQLHYLTTQARDYVLAHGIVYRPLATDATAGQVPSDSVIHAPISLLPSPFPKSLFQHAQSLQPLYDQLYAKIASHPSFLSSVIPQLIEFDDFTKRLWQIYQQQQQQPSHQLLTLGLFRSDYLLHQPDDQDKAKLEIKQVEFNTISSSFGSLCTKVSQMHQYLARTTDGYFGTIDQDRLPDNQALNVLSLGLQAAHTAYLSSRPSSSSSSVLPVVVLFVVQPNERNAFDQRAIEYQLDQSGIQVIRMTFQQLADAILPLDSDQQQQQQQPRYLHLKTPDTQTIVQVSVVYYRAGYSPTDYPTESEWQTRLLLQQSYAIQCPSVALQLAGTKKVQQVLADPIILSQLIPNPSQQSLLSDSFVDMYPLDDDSLLGQKGFQLAIQQSQRFVLKPQREGGGNNIYRNQIPTYLNQIGIDKQAYILMSLIQTPIQNNLSNLLLRHGADSFFKKPIQTVSELGVYGSILFNHRCEKEEGDDDGIKFHKSGGFLLRTKTSDSNEGGVAVGFSVIDTPYLF